MMRNGHFVISLDFELYWGVHDVFTEEQYGTNIRNVQKVIPRLLTLFKKYDIHATFAVVGAMYHNDANEFFSNISDANKLPAYKKIKMSPYVGFGKEKVCKYPELFFQKRLIELVRDSGQEIGTHTYCHYYCNEEGAGLSSFDYDIAKAVAIAKDNGDRVTSIIFPRNQIPSSDFEKVLISNGITCCRKNGHKSYDDNRLKNRITRTLSAYLPIIDLSSPLPNNDELIKIDANHFLRAYSSLPFLNHMQICKIKKAMKQAAVQSKVFHLWWHPHNFGLNMDENFNMLEYVLKYFVQMRDRYNMQSSSMRDLENIIRKGNKK